MTCGEPAHKEPQVTTDEFIARNGEDTEDTRVDVRGERVNVRVHIPTFSVTPGVFDIFRRGEIYFCFGFLSFLGMGRGRTVSNRSCPSPISAGPPTSMT